MSHRPSSPLNDSGACSRSSGITSKLGILVEVHASSSQPFSHLQQHSSIWPIPGALVSTRGSRFCYLHIRCAHSRTAVKTPHPAILDNRSRDKSDLYQLGFTDQQVARLLLYLAAQRRCFKLDKMDAWLQLLVRHHVQQPHAVISKYPLILSHKAETVAENADAVVLWMSSLGMTSVHTAQLLGEWPMLLTIPNTTGTAVAAWFSDELKWSSSMVATMLSKFPQLFCLSTSDNLAPKLAWFVAQGFSRKTMGGVFFRAPSLLGCTVQRSNTQLKALKAIGMSESQVLHMAIKAPTLLSLSINGQTTQAKVRFLTQEMRKEVTELLSCPTFLTYSLVQRIGPRWSFHSRYCNQGKQFNLSTQLIPSDQHFAEKYVSSSLDAECASRSISRIQLYEEHRTQWQQGLGREWDGKREGAGSEPEAKLSEEDP